MYNINSGYGQLQAHSLFNSRPTSGKTFLVGVPSNSDDATRLRSLFKPDPNGAPRHFETLDALLASGYLRANRGDVVFIAPGYTDTVASAGDIALATAGVRFVGLGTGTQRPKITFTTATAATISVSAADISIENVIFSANFADIVSVFTLTAAKNFKLVNCRFQAEATNMNFLAVVDTSTVDNAADGLSVIGCEWIEPDLATVSMLDVDADLDGLVFTNNYLNLGVNTSDLPAIAGVATGKDLTNVKILDNVIIRLNDANPLLIVADTTTANSGVIGRNYVRHLDTAGELLVTAGTNIAFMDNKASAAVDASGYVVPTADS